MNGHKILNVLATCYIVLHLVLRDWGMIFGVNKKDNA